MCLIVFAWRPGHAQPLIVAANRDEFDARPVCRWPSGRTCPKSMPVAIRKQAALGLA